MAVDTSFLLRVDIHGDESEFRSKIVEWLGKQGNAIGCYECPRDGNGHYHIWLRCKKTCASLRQNFKYNFPECKGNRSYSIKQAEGNLQYITKGDSEDIQPVIFVNTMGITEEEIATARSERWAKTRELEEKKQKTKATFLDVVEYHFEQWYEEEKKRPGKASNWVPSRERILDWLIEEFSVLRKLWDVGVLTKYVNYFEYQVNPKEHRESIKRVMWGKY